MAQINLPSIHKEEASHFCKGGHWNRSQAKIGTVAKTASVYVADANPVLQVRVAAPPPVHSTRRHVRPAEAIAAFQQLMQSPPPSSDRRCVGSFLLTAYVLDPQSTGKPWTAPDFGVTSSGSRAVVGRTVAVDPRVIPIGTPIFIEGIGWRLAEDVGGAVKGRHIDVLLHSESEAVRFGVKRNVRVYVAIPEVAAE